MLNITQKIIGTKLTLTIDLKQRHGKTKSGKSEMIASTQGNASVEGKEGITFGLNVYEKVTK